MTEQLRRTAADEAALDNPVWAALTTSHRRFAEFVGGAGRYLADVAPLAALRDPRDPADWYDLRRLVGRGRDVVLPGDDEIPLGWEVSQTIAGMQLVATDALRTEPDPEAVGLGAAGVPEMLDLVGRTQPGPFLPRTVELGTYLGIRRHGALVAMAGERVRPPGWTEVSAVCTDPAYRGRGLATRLVRAVAAGIRERGDVPFLHVSASNTNAIRLYESMGFVVRRDLLFRLLRSV